jgi:hypothetical protein
VSRTEKRILYAMERDERILARFWERVSKLDADDACWVWRGPMNKRYPSIQVGRWCTAAARIAWWSSTGSFPLGGRFYRTCANTRCVRPHHLAWSLGRRAEYLLDSYEAFAPSGIPVRTSVAPRERPRVYRFVSADAVPTTRVPLHLETT